jgi:hypothetical protein
MELEPPLPNTVIPVKKVGWERIFGIYNYNIGMFA